jgi:hypothetical protein
MKNYLIENGFLQAGAEFSYEIGSNRIVVSFKPTNTKQLALLQEKYPKVPTEVLELFSKSNGIAYALRNRSKAIDEGKISSLNEMFDNFKDDPIPFPADLDIVAYNDDFDLQAQYMKRSDPHYGKLYTNDNFDNFENLDEVARANIVRRSKKLAPIFGYDDDIVIDIQSAHPNGYQIYLLAGRSGTGNGLQVIDLDLNEFLHHFLLFGFFGHWYTAFLPQKDFTKKELRTASKIKELEKYFRASPIHQEKLDAIIAKFEGFK